MAKLAFNRLVQELDGNGEPYAGALLFTYEAGSSTKATTYQDDAGSTAHANPIELDANGRIPAGVWLTEGRSYKFVLAPSDDTDPPASPIWTLDDITGINDASIALDQWSESGMSATFVSTTQFTVTGDQTSALHVGRRVKITDAGGVKYGLITVSAFTTLTTVTVLLDSGVLENPIASLSLGVQTADNPSEPVLTDAHALRSGSSDKTKKVRLEVDGLTTATTRVLTVQDKDGSLAVTSEFAYSNVAGSAGRVPLPRMWISGLTYALAADTDHDITIAAGECRDATNAHNLILASALTKRIDAAWAVGTNQGGLDGSESVAGTPDADTWYYVWLIKRSDTGAVDALFSESASAPTMPADYDFKRLVGAVRTDGSANIVAFTTHEMSGGGLEMWWTTPTTDVNLSNTLTTSRRTDVVKVPTSFAVLANVRVYMQDVSGNQSAIVCSPDETDAAPNSTAPGINMVTYSASANSAGRDMRIRTSAAGAIAARSTLATVDLYTVVTLGFEWSRR